MANPTSESLIGEKLGNYRLERLLGRGRMGVVYLAKDEALLRSTAVKVLSWVLSDAVGQNPEAWFISEARNAARINHPHVVQIYGVARHGPHCYIAMEYVEGASADEWIRRKGAFTLERATELLIQVADALQAAHEANVIHRDVKPENLLLRSDGRAKLGDFGMAVDVTRSRGYATARAGTPYYTAPEIWRGSVASVASDIYALGATYYYLLTGRAPYPASELNELVAAHLNAAIPELPTVHASVAPACQAILHRCLAKSPNHRYTDAQALALEARALLAQLTDPLPPPSARIPVPSPTPPSMPAKPSGASAWPAADWRSFFGCVRDPFVTQEVRPSESGSRDTGFGPQLDPRELREYLVAQLASCQGPAGKSVLWTPDALLMLAHFSNGDIRRLNELVIDALKDAAGRKSRVVDSWDIWACRVDVGGQSKPPNWPSPEVLALLNKLRLQAGLPTRSEI